MSHSQLRILLVDDDPTLRRLLAQQLRLAGYIVREANDGREAYEAILADCPDMLVTDWNMPGMDGQELCEKLRQAQLLQLLLQLRRLHLGRQGLKGRCGGNFPCCRGLCQGLLFSCGECLRWDRAPQKETTRGRPVQA